MYQSQIFRSIGAIIVLLMLSRGFDLRLSNKTLARKLGYGFSIYEAVSEDEDFIGHAKAQLERLP